jgi:hypothetical protein
MDRMGVPVLLAVAGGHGVAGTDHDCHSPEVDQYQPEGGYEEDPQIEVEEKSIMVNPRFELLLANYRTHDLLTSLLAGIALLIVLVGWVLCTRVRTRFDRFVKNAYFSITLLIWVLTLIVMTKAVIGGAS